jgi:hypothetical protein
VLGDGSRGHGARGGTGAAPGPGGRSWSHEAHGSSRAALCQETGVDTMRHLGMFAHLVFRLDMELVRGGIQYLGYRQNQVVYVNWGSARHY